MSSKKTKFSVGIFVFAGIIIAVFAIIWLGMSRFLEKGRFYVTYFNESVQGLDMDSPVKYRGVAIGRVDSIRVAPDSKLIEVVMKIESGQALDSDIVAQLKSVGITGSMFVELDRKKKGEPDRSPPLSFPSEYPIVASKPSEISQLLKGLDDFLSQIKALDLEGISDKIKGTLDSLNLSIADSDVKGISSRLKVTLDTLNQSIADAGIKKISTDMHAVAKRLRHIMENERWEDIIASADQAGRSFNALLDKATGILDTGETTLNRVEGIISDEQNTIKTAFQDFKKAMANANVFLEKSSSLIGTTDESISQLKSSLLMTAMNLERASENLNRLMELVAEHPPQLLFGEPPAPRHPKPQLQEEP